LYCGIAGFGLASAAAGLEAFWAVTAIDSAASPLIRIIAAHVSCRLLIRTSRVRSHLAAARLAREAFCSEPIVNAANGQVRSAKASRYDGR
jgi:hypothetical protein